LGNTTAGRHAQCDIRRHSGAGQWISISYVGGGGAADGGMRVDGMQHD